MSNKGVKLDKGTFTIEVKYSDEAIKKKLIKFTVKQGDEIVLTADELISMLVNQVNSEVLSASFVETDRINVVEVGRQLQCVVDKDLKKGEVININYTHPYPIEFALIEEAWKIAQIKKDTKVTELTAEYIEKIKSQIKPDMQNYIKKFYEGFKSINLNKNMDEVKNEEVVAVEPEIVEHVVSEEDVVNNPGEGLVEGEKIGLVEESPVVEEAPVEEVA